MSFEIRITATSYKQQQKQNFDRHHGARALAPIPADTNVWITGDDQPVEGRVVLLADTPRSYIVEIQSGQVRRNRLHLNPMPDDATVDHTQPPGCDPILTRTQTGTAIHPHGWIVNHQPRKGRCEIDLVTCLHLHVQGVC